jgi:chromosome segregation ATPase
VEESIGGEKPILLTAPVFRGGELVEEGDNARLRTDLAELLKSRRANTRNTERELQAEVTKAEQLEDFLKQKKNEEAQKKTEVKNMQEEIAAFREAIEKEDAAFDARITSLKDSLHRIRSQEGVDMQAKNRQLTHLLETVAQAKMKQQVEHKKGIDFLERVCERTVTYMEECTKYRDMAAKTVLEQSLTVVTTIKNSIINMNKKVDSAVKAVEQNL